MKTKLAVVLILTGLTGFNCASTQNLELEHRTRMYNYPANIVFNAVEDSVQEFGYFITQKDREEGIINTDYKTGGIWQSIFAGGNFRSKMGVNITEYTNGSTKVVVMISREDHNDDDHGWESQFRPKSMSIQHYTDFFKRVEVNLQNYAEIKEAPDTSMPEDK